MFDPIHLPSSRGRNCCSPSRSFAWTLCSPNIDGFGFHSCGPNAWGSHYPGSACNRRGQQCWVQALAGGTPRNLPSSFLPFDPSAHIQGDPRALVTSLIPYSISGQDQSPWGLGSSIDPFQMKAKTLGAWVPAILSLPYDVEGQLTVTGWKAMMSHRSPRY